MDYDDWLTKPYEEREPLRYWDTDVCPGCGELTVLHYIGKDAPWPYLCEVCAEIERENAS